MPEKIALGLGDNIDYEIAWDSAVIEALIGHYGVCAAELTTGQAINSERDLLISILGFVQAGIGGERHVASSAIIEQFARRFDLKITLGGTSVRAAIAMRKLGHTSALHLATVNEHVRRLIPPDSPYVCSNAQDSAYPHLIVQFGQGTRVRAGDIDLCVSRPNRIIYHDDHDNIRMAINEGFAALITAARVFLVSGFNAMHSEALLRERLDALLRVMGALPPDTWVFYEDAGFYDPSFSHLILSVLGPRISIYSLNEDELQGHVGRKVDMLDAAQVKEALADLQKLISVPLIVVHSMHWALAYGEGSARLERALRGGVTMATTRLCYGDDWTVENYREVSSLLRNEQGAAFAAAIAGLLGNQVRCVPVAQVDQVDATTIGLGDAFVGGFLPALV